MGLPNDFLTIHSIDSLFFEALPSDLKQEIILQYLPAHSER